MNKKSLLYVQNKNVNARIRLICFPYAGGSSLTYSSWANYLGADVEVVLLQLPGRAARFAEAPYETMGALVNDIFIALDELTPRPFILYGHSMGARVAYELILMLYRHQRKLPLHMIASGSSAPFIGRKRDVTFNLPDADFIQSLRDLNGSPEEVLANSELMELMLPTLRSDFKIIEEYCNVSKMVLPTKISMFAGRDDDIDAEDIRAWASLFKGTTGIHWFEGDHFFVDKGRDQVLFALNKVIEEIQ